AGRYDQREALHQHRQFRLAHLDGGGDPDVTGWVVGILLGWLAGRLGHVGWPVAHFLNEGRKRMDELQAAITRLQAAADRIEAVVTDLRSRPAPPDLGPATAAVTAAAEKLEQIAG